MKLAIFDLDNTLLAGDSDVGWGEYLVAHGIVDAHSYGETNERFYQDYLRGSLDIHAYQTFQLQILAQHPLEQVLAWREEYLEHHIKPMLASKSAALIEQDRQAGAELLIITATNRFITEPIAQWLNIDTLIATEPEIIDGQYTGGITGIPSYAEGKITRLQQWAEERGIQWRADDVESWFYSDSHNDLPLLEQVTHPVAVDPDDTLRAAAQARGWRIISLRH